LPIIKLTCLFKYPVYLFIAGKLDN